MTTGSNNTTPTRSEMSSEELQQLLASAPAIRSDFNMLMIKLKRRQVSGPSQCPRATLEIIRSLLGRYNFTSTDHMMKTVRAIGRELSSAAQTEVTIGNLVRRILFIIREEHATFMRQLIMEEQRARSSSKDFTKKAAAASTSSNRRDRSNSVSSNNSYGGHDDEEGFTGRSQNYKSIHPMDAIGGLLSSHNEIEDFSKSFPNLRGVVISALNEMSNEIDNYATIVQRAPDYIHENECILTYGYSRIVELFLKAAGAKRRFQLIIAEAAPNLDGHKLAHILSKVPSISVTLIPDSNIYAIMARVNKVILSPQAIMADGGTIANSGHLMVSIAAKEFSVPVVNISGAFSLTPLFAHNQTLALQQLQSPCSAIPYNADINFSNVEVSYPAFDHITPDLISLFVTNDGSQLPSYMFRLLSEHYHPNDYNL